MSLTFEQRERHAARLIAAAERDLGQLTPGQRRDLVADRTDWSSETVANAVEAYPVWAPMREEERVALVAFRNEYGREWKQYLMAAWLSHRYKGRHMGGEDTGVLRGIRNQRGHAWLERLTPAELGFGSAEPAPERPQLGLKFGDLTVQVDSSTQYATIYRGDGKPAGTLQRRRVYSTGPEWQVFRLDGSKAGEGDFVRSCLAQLDSAMHAPVHELPAGEFFNTHEDGSEDRF